MSPPVQAEEYFADLLRIAGSEGHQSNRLQAVEYLLCQFEITLEASSVTVGPGELEAHRQRRKLADSIADALQDPSLSDASRSVLSHAYGLLANWGLPPENEDNFEPSHHKKTGTLWAARPRHDEWLRGRPSRDRDLGDPTKPSAL